MRPGAWVTGFVVESIDEAVSAVERIGDIDRATCRLAVEKRFDARRMALDYVAIYQRQAAQALTIPSESGTHSDAAR